MIDIVKSSSKHLLSVINDVLDLSRFENINFKLENKPVCLVNLIESTIDLIDNKKKLPILYTINSKLPHFILGDSIRLKQVLLNLLSNAYKFTSNDSNNSKILITVDKIKDINMKTIIKFGVHDTGIGIPPEKIKCLFQEYEQLDISRTKQYGGSGLGLSICKQIMSLLKGKIYVTSNEKGSTFYFEFFYDTEDQPQECSCVVISEKLKIGILYDSNYHLSANYWKNWLDNFCFNSKVILIDDKQNIKEKFDIIITKESNLICDFNTKIINMNNIKKATKLINKIKNLICNNENSINIVDEDNNKITSKSKKNILIVEDNMANQKILKKLINNLGFDVTIVNNGKECLDLVSLINYDVIFMDIIMPIMDGLTATLNIRKNKLLFQPIIIALTANTDEKSILDTKNAGMNEFLSKPLNSNKLKEILVKYI
jgi:CheY-like chemotaxis protein